MQLIGNNADTEVFNNNQSTEDRNNDLTRLKKPG